MKALILLYLVLVGCQTQQVIKKSENRSAEEHIQMGRKFLHENKYSEALTEFEEVLKNHTTNSQIPLATFYSGVALFELGQFKQACERFRRFTTGQPTSTLIGQAFYKLGVCFENLGEPTAAIAAYVDSLNRLTSQEGPTRIEVQARLASSYARLGNEDAAKKYYDLAEKELIVQRRKQTSKGVPDWLPETLYNMGKMSLRTLSIDNYETGLKSLERSQMWLLRVVRLNSSKWSKLSADEIINIYSQAWDLIGEVPLSEEPDKVLALKEQQDKKIAMGLALNQVLSRLRLERSLDYSKENKYEQSVFEHVLTIENQLEVLLKSRPIEQGLTPAAEEREGLRRNGRLIPVETERKKAEPTK